MATVTGKMTVDLYANPDPFVQGMKAAENAAKKSGAGIAGQLEKINAKQMKGAVGGLLGGLGAIGLIDAGLNAANELVKGFRDGSIKGFGDAVTAIGQTIATTLEGLPIVGSGGKLIASMLDAGGYMGGAMGAEQDQQQSRIDAANKQKEGASAAQAEMRIEAEKLQLETELQKIKDGTFFIEKSSAELAKQALSDRMMNAGMSLNAIYEAQQLYDQGLADKKLDDDAAAAAITAKNELASAQKTLNDLQDQATRSTMSVRDAELDRLASMSGMTSEMVAQGMAAWDAVEAGKASKTLVEQTLAAQKTANEDYSSGIEASIELDRAKANRTASATSVDTALGSIKLQGVTDFSKSKEIEKAKEALSKAIETASNTKGTYDQLVKLNQAIGATP